MYPCSPLWINKKSGKQKARGKEEEEEEESKGEKREGRKKYS